MTTHNTQEQDLRTAAKKLCDVVDDLVACPFPERFSLKVWVPVAGKAEADLRALLAAPPRLVDAERVEDEIKAAFNEAAEARDEAGYSGTPASCIRFLSAEVERLEKALASPAHSPDKAVTREGSAIPADKAAYSGDEVIAAALWDDYRANQRSITIAMTPWSSLAEDSPAKIKHRRQARVIQSLAPKPTGTEAGWGVVPAGWKLVPEKATHRMWAAFRNADETAITFHQGYKAMLAATPTPPVSPSPDSTGSAGDTGRLRTSDQLRILSGYHSDKLPPGIGQELCELADEWDEHVDQLREEAALTPSALIADPSRYDGNFKPADGE